MRKRRVISGFTLIELLVVISIIGILVAVIYPNFSSSRDQAKNTALQAQLKDVQLALELYKAENGYYPPPQTGGPSGCEQSDDDLYTANSVDCDTQPIIAGAFAPDFIAKLPSHKDSANSECNIWYYTDDFDSSTAGIQPSWYKLIAERCHKGATSAATGIQPNDDFGRCPSSCPNINTSGSVCDKTTQDFYESYAVYSFGGQCE